MATDWVQWRREVFGDPYLVWHEGADFAELRRRVGTEPEVVTAWISAGLRERDAVAAQAVAESGLPDLPGLLKQQMIDASGVFAVRGAQALFRLTGDAAWVRPVVEVLIGADHWGDRLDAAIALAEFPATPFVVASVALATADEDELVRHHATETLEKLRRKSRG
ncbi:hypothetical protein HDA40_000454 [Hamadaea flava]|uniref:HEAT repeat domain-containing protein n=1 Tax=Hamadaea flava TaxID=1742688 RepID=A0ABV8M1D2_9ACTN|nr:hypothetical protein [Hamadaea flava]MCP2321947.1 hypothetical protein [Hamadaea flava]